MLYVEDILLPDEKILHHAKVHYILYFPGIFLMCLSVFLMYVMPGLVDFLITSYETAQNVMSVIKFLSVSLFMAGIAMVLRAWLKIYSTEMIITDRRILVKIGISTATTAEIDRGRISSVVVSKPIMGRILDYGWVTILGYSGNITGLPVLAKPHEIQKHIYQKMQ